jgi:hypothetical protein
VIEVISKPLVAHTLRWFWRTPGVRILTGCLLLGSLVPADAVFQQVLVFYPLLLGTVGISGNHRQDCIDLILCRPLKRSQFVFSKWAAFMALVVLTCIIHAISCMVAGIALTNILVAFLSLVGSASVSAALATMNRMIILDPRRQGTCVLLTFFFAASFTAETTFHEAHAFAVFRKLIFPTSFAASYPNDFDTAIHIPMLGVQDIFGTIFNVALLLAISCFIIHRQEFSYALD